MECSGNQSAIFCNTSDTTIIKAEPYKNPLPKLAWANREKVWQAMVAKDESTQQYRKCSLHSAMFFLRANLLNWIMGVCDKLHLRRETYYLTVDYIDRFLTLSPSVPEKDLVLVGITSLMVASKVEEVIHPSLKRFASMCNGVFGKEDLLKCEDALLKMLDWKLKSSTPNSWLNMYMQIYFAPTEEDTRANFEFCVPQYPARDFIRASTIMDLFSLDPAFVHFKYSTIAASSMFLLYGQPVAVRVSGMEWDDIKNCVDHMGVYSQILSKSKNTEINSSKYCRCCRCTESMQAYLAHNVWVPAIIMSENYALQPQAVTLEQFEKVTLCRLNLLGFEVHKQDEIEGKTCKKSSEAFRGEKGDSSPAVCKNQVYTIHRTILPEGDDNVGHHGYFDSKSEFTFNELLEGIHSYINI